MINDFIFSLSYAFLHHNTVLFVVIDFSINLSRYMELVIAWIIFLIFPKKTDFWKQMFLELHLRIINDNSKLSFYQFSIFSNCDDFYLNSNDTWGCFLFVFCIWYFKEMKKSFFFYYLKKKNIVQSELMIRTTTFWVCGDICACGRHNITSSHLRHGLEHHFLLFLNFLLVDLLFLSFQSLSVFQMYQNL